MSSTSTLQEIKALTQQVENFEAAIAALKSPHQIEPSGNSLADILHSRFQQLDSEEERAKSLQVATNLLEEVKSRLDAKKQKVKQVHEAMSARRDYVHRLCGQINEKSIELQELLARLKEAGESFQNLGKEIGDDQILLDWAWIPTFPKMDLSGSRIVVGQGFCFESDCQNQ